MILKIIKKILIHIKKYILKLKKDKLNISKVFLCYFGSWDETLAF